MKRRKTVRKILQNNHAVSEEFTTLPSLTVIMIGLTLFILLVANTYSSYEHRVESLQKYQTANFIATKLTNPDCLFMHEGGKIHYLSFNIFNTTPQWDSLQNQYKSAGIGFRLQLSWDQEKIDSNPDDYNPQTTGDRVAISREVSIQLNPAITVPGKLTIITWSV
jgi:hypothetical protein